MAKKPSRPRKGPRVVIVRHPDEMVDK